MLSVSFTPTDGGNYNGASKSVQINVLATGPTPTPTPTPSPTPTPAQGNPIDDTTFFVTQHYSDFLGRAPDAGGLQFWVNNIESCGSDTNCRAVKRIDTSAAFFLSIEFQNTGYLVYRTYQVAYGNANGVADFPTPPHFIPVPAVRRSDFIADMPVISQGVQVGIGDWQTQLENNKRAYMSGFVQMARFTAAYPSAMPADQFVNQLNANAGYVLLDTDRVALIANLNNGTMTRAQVLRQIAENPTLQQRESDHAFVLMEYFGYLRRNPNDAPDADFSGYAFWLQKLDQFNGNYVQAEMVKAFISSIEYRSRFGTP